MATLPQSAIDQILKSVQMMEESLRQVKAQLEAAGISENPGVVGVFDGEFMITEEGKRIGVPANYASKTMLVSGDTLRMTEASDGGQAKFKQIGKMERLKASGFLAKKDGKFEVLTDQGSFKVLSAAVKHYDGQVGDTVSIQYAKQHTKGSWAAIEKIVSAGAAAAGQSGLPGGQTIQVQHAPKQAQLPAEQVAPTSEAMPVVAPLPESLPELKEVAPVAEMTAVAEELNESNQATSETSEVDELPVVAAVEPAVEENVAQPEVQSQPKVQPQPATQPSAGQTKVVAADTVGEEAVKTDKRKTGRVSERDGGRSEGGARVGGSRDGGGSRDSGGSRSNSSGGRSSGERSERGGDRNERSERSGRSERGPRTERNDSPRSGAPSSDRRAGGGSGDRSRADNPVRSDRSSSPRPDTAPRSDSPRTELKPLPADRGQIDPSSVFDGDDLL